MLINYNILFSGTLIKCYFRQNQERITMKHNDDIEEILYDNCPVDDFLGFTPTELNYLVYDTFGDKSPLQFRNFQAFTGTFDWPFNDLHPQKPIGQFGWAFSVYMLYRFFLWFGFVTVKRRNHYLDLEPELFTGTGIIKRIFSFDD